jgi:tetratricopeptide (TPR) repeat protein
MNCPKCGAHIAEAARFCSSCGVALDAAARSSTQVQLDLDVGTVAGGEVTGLEVGKVGGDLAIESTVNHVENSVVNGTYVDARTITNNIMTLGPEALDQIVGRLATMLRVDDRMLAQPGSQPPAPENVSRQIAEVATAQKEAAAKGVAVSPEALYRLGMLAAYDRNYASALEYFRQATQANPEYGDAYFAIARLQQSLAVDDIRQRDYDAAVARLADARSAAMHTDPTDAQALSVRGYVAKTLAQVAEARGQGVERENYYQEAAHLFQTAAKLDPNEPGVHNGLGNVQHALGNLDAAIGAYARAIDLAPAYASAHHDLASAYEDKIKADPTQAALWRQRALAEWRVTYELAPADSAFTAESLVEIGKRINWLKHVSI